MLALVTALALATPPEASAARLEVAAGLGASLYQSVYSYEASPLLEAAVERRVRRSWTATAGARVSSGPGRAEGFLRFSAAPVLGRWRPALGVELGISGGDTFSEGDLLLREFRAVTEDVGPVYVAFHATPLRFRVRERWRVSALELQVGSHLEHLGRTLRVQVGLLSLGAAL